MVTVELIVIMGSVMRWGSVLMSPAEFSFPGHVGMVILGAGGPGILRLLMVTYGQIAMFPASFLLARLGLGSFEVVRRLRIVVVRVLGLALVFVRSLRLIGCLVVTGLSLVIFTRRAMVIFMPHMRWSSLVSVSVPVVRMTVRTRMRPIWVFPGHRRWGSMWMDEAEQTLPEPAVGRRRRRAETGWGRRGEIAMWWWRRWRRRRWISAVMRRWRRRRRVTVVMWWWRWVITMVRRRRRTLAERWRVRETGLPAVWRRRVRVSAIVGVVPVPGLSKAVMRATVVLVTWTMRMRTRSMRSMRSMRPMRPWSPSNSIEGRRRTLDSVGNRFNDALQAVTFVNAGPWAVVPFPSEGLG